MKKHMWTICFSASLFLFTLYTALDTFVISSVYQSDVPAENLSMFDNLHTNSENETAKTDAGTQQDQTAVSGQTENAGRNRAKSPKSSASAKVSATFGKIRNKDSASQTLESSASAENADPQNRLIGTYEDENIKIEINEYVVNDTAVYAADVRVSSARYLRTAFANDAYGKNVRDTTSNIAEAHGAILAINGDYYGARESGYVIRNGIVYRDEPEDSDVLCIYADGRMESVDPAEITAQELADSGVWQAFSFGPTLVSDSEVSIDLKTEVGRAMASNPRTAIGIIDDLHYLFVVSDGRTGESVGLSLYELAQFMKSQGVETAYNLDGGGSSTMVFNGSLVNIPTTSGRTVSERKVSDIVYVG